MSRRQPIRVWPSAIDRFWACVHMEPMSGCWLWAGQQTRSRHGYGRLDVSRQRVVAHRFSYETFVGPIPSGMDLDHACNQTLCVNPEHLRPMQHRANVLRGASPSALHARQTHCKRGHELTGDNARVYVRMRGCRSCTERICLACRRAARPGEKERRRLREGTVAA